MFEIFKKIIPQNVFPKTLERTELALKYMQKEVFKFAIIEKVRFKNQDFTLLYTAGNKYVVIKDLTPNIINNNNFVHYQYAKLNSLKKYTQDHKTGTDALISDFFANIETGIFVTVRFDKSDDQKNFEILKNEFAGIDSVKHYARKLDNKDSLIAKIPDSYNVNDAKNRKIYMNFMTAWENTIGQNVK